MARFLKWLLALLLLLLIAVIGVLGYATATDGGLQRLLSLGQQYTPGELVWRQATGRLAGPLDLEGLSYRQDNGLSVAVDRAALRWQPSALLSRKLAVQRLSLSGVAIHLPKREHQQKPDEGPLTLPDIHLPLDIAIDELDLADIRIFPWGAEQPIVVERIRLSALGEGDNLQLVNLDIHAPEGEAHLTGTVRPVGSYPLDLQLSWRFRHPEFGDFQGKGAAEGDLDKLRLTQSVSGVINAELTADLVDVVNDPGWDAELKLKADSLGDFNPALKGSPLQATLTSKGKLQQFSAEGNIATALEQTGPVALDFSVAGNTRAIRIEKAALKLVEYPGEVALAGQVKLQPLHLKLQGDWHELGWPLKTARREYRLPVGTVSFKGDPKDFSAVISTDLEGPQLGKLQLKLNAQGAGDLLKLTALDLKALAGPLHLQAEGEYDLNKRTLSGKGHWQSLRWPLAAATAPLVASPDGDFNVAGRVDDYRFELNAKASGKDVPDSAWRLTGTGSDRALSRFDLTGKLLDGELNASGKAAWKPDVTWDVSLEGKRLNPGVKWPEIPGSLNLQLVSKGGLVNGRPDLTAKIRTLNGRLRGRPLKGSGEVAVKGDMLKVDDLRLSSGSASLSADGELGEQWHLAWQVTAPDLAAMAPQLKGSVKGKGKLQGSADQPRLAFDLDVRNLVAGASRIKRLAGKADIDVAGKRRSTLDFTGKGLQLAGQKWSKMALTGSGVPARHGLTLSLDGVPAKLKLALSGGLKNRQWQGQLTELSALKTQVGDWHLARPAGLKIDDHSAVTDQLCLSSKPSKICLDGRWNKATGATGKIEISALDAKRFSALIPAGMQLQTSLDGTVTGKVDSRGKAEGVAEFDLTKGRLVVSGDTDPVTIQFGESRVESAYQGKTLDSKLRFDLGKLGGVNGDIKLTALDTKPRLAGGVSAEIADLSLLSAFVPQLQAVQGRLHADLKLAGPVAMPQVKGELVVDGFAAEVPQISLHIKDTRLSARSTGQGPLKISGQAKSGEGLLKLSGEVDPATRELRLKLKGDHFQVANTRNIRAEISPDMQLRMDSKGMRVEGELVVPKAFIKAGGGGGEDSLVTVSSDVVIVEDGKPAKKAKTGNFFLNLRVVLGDDIKVEVADFKGALKGNLVIEQEPELAPRGTGVIEVVNGDYVVYGQELKIQRGRILFGGGPVDNPRLDLDVARKVAAYDVLAGARIRGTAQAPLLQLYSEPAMPDASILSYMLLGQPPGTKGGSYTLGKYLTPDLYVGYGIGLFNAINTFNMRYKLTEKLALQAASGAASSADLIYTIER